jgi:hypothetical protein
VRFETEQRCNVHFTFTSPLVGLVGEAASPRSGEVGEGVSSHKLRLLSHQFEEQRAGLAQTKEDFIRSDPLSRSQCNGAAIGLPQPKSGVPDFGKLWLAQVGNTDLGQGEVKSLALYAASHCKSAGRSRS